MELLVHPVTVFCPGMPEMQASHMCITFAHKEISYKVHGPTRSENAQHLLVQVYHEHCAQGAGESSKTVFPVKFTVQL